MKLRGIEFGNILGGAGVQGFFGEGYPYQWLWKCLGLDFTGMTFVTKTATLLPRKGNMPPAPWYQLEHYLPRCIKIRPFRRTTLNAVGLTNPGIRILLEAGHWQQRTEPFMISIAPLGEKLYERLHEMRAMVDILEEFIDQFQAPVGLQINVSCPNTEHGQSRKYSIARESAWLLDIASRLYSPLMLKYSIANAPIKEIAELSQHPYCDGICVSNTIPFGWQGIDWKKAWGSNTSPLAHLGGGGLSGPPLRSLTCEWISRARDAGFTKPINGGGGIFCPEDLEDFAHAGASSGFIATVAEQCPWQVPNIIHRANEIRWEV